jgi:hypothetical protein
MNRSALPSDLGVYGRVAQAEHPAGLAEEARDVARAVVGHHALDPNTESLEPAQRPDEEASDRLAFLVRQDLDEGEPGRVVNRHMAASALRHPPSPAVCRALGRHR